MCNENANKVMKQQMERIYLVLSLNVRCNHTKFIYVSLINGNFNIKHNIH